MKLFVIFLKKQQKATMKEFTMKNSLTRQMDLGTYLLKKLKLKEKRKQKANRNLKQKQKSK